MLQTEPKSLSLDYGALRDLPSVCLSHLVAFFSLLLTECKPSNLLSHPHLAKLLPHSGVPSARPFFPQIFTLLLPSHHSSFSINVIPGELFPDASSQAHLSSLCAVSMHNLLQNSALSGICYFLFLSIYILILCLPH